MLSREEGGGSWGIDRFSKDAVDPCSHVFFLLDPRGHGVFFRFSSLGNG